MIAKLAYRIGILFDQVCVHYLEFSGAHLVGKIDYDCQGLVPSYSNHIFSFSEDLSICESLGANWQVAGVSG